MSLPGFLERLLDGAEVEWMPLGDVIQDTSNIRWAHIQGARRYVDLTSVDIKTKTVMETTGVTADSAPSRAQKLLEEDDVIFATTRPTQQRCCLISAELDGQVASTGYCVLRAIKTRVIPKWILHWISSTEFKLYVDEHQSGAAYPAISDGKVKAFNIPIPCPDNPKKSLEIQAEIVRILDTFTELTNELTNELEARKKQYNHYRDQLLSHASANMDWKPLGCVGDVRMCKRVMKNQTSADGDIPFFKIGTFGRQPNAYINRELFEEFKRKYSYPKVGEVLISASGTIGRAVVFDGEEAYFQDSNIVWLENDESKVLNKYLFYFYQIAQWHVSDGGVIKRLYNENIKKTLIAVPYPNDPEKSLAEQTRIVAILNKMTSLTEGLSSEIEQREKQYAYYRDLLFSFPKPETVAS